VEGADVLICCRRRKSNGRAVASIFLSDSVAERCTSWCVTDRVLFEWSDIQVAGPGAGDIYDYGIWFFGYYDDNTGGQAEGYGAAFPESSNGSFWLDTSVGSANSAQMVKWTMQVEVHLAENAPIGEYSLRIGGNSIDAGTKSILSAVPEPSSALLWGLGSMVVAALVRLRSRRVRG